MSGIHPLKGCANLFSAIEDDCFGLFGLASALRAIDIENVDDPDTLIRHMGYTLQTIASSIMQTVDSGKNQAEKALATLPAE